MELEAEGQSILRLPVLAGSGDLGGEGKENQVSAKAEPVLQRLVPQHELSAPSGSVSLTWFHTSCLTRKSKDVYEDTHIINGDNSLIHRPGNQYTVNLLGRLKSRGGLCLLS